MNDFDTLQLYIALPVFAGLAGLGMYYYWHGDKLFKLLATRHPKYYKENGEPLNFGEPVGSVWAGLYLMLLLFRGVPKDFPDDAEARDLALQSRKIGLALFLGIAIAAAVVNIFLIK